VVQRDWLPYWQRRNASSHRNSQGGQIIIVIEAIGCALIGAIK